MKAALLSMSIPTAPPALRFTRATNVTNILDFGKHILGVEINLNLWVDEEKQVWFETQEIMSLLAVSTAQITSVRKQLPLSFSAQTQISLMSDDAVLSLLFAINTPFTRVFKKFVKYIINQLYSTGSVTLDDAKSHVNELMSRCEDAESILRATRLDRDNLEQLHATDVDEIQMLRYQIMDLRSQLAATKKNEHSAKYTHALETRFLRPVHCWGIPYSTIAKRGEHIDVVDATDAEHSPPAYDDIDEQTTCFIELGSEPDHKPCQLLGIVFCVNRIQIMKCLKSSDIPGVYIGSYENIVHGVQRQICK
jgi:polyhydroxyalkanoate synthesis regulator phasin